jgi:hypothetical protein
MEVHFVTNNNISHSVAPPQEYPSCYYKRWLLIHQDFQKLKYRFNPCLQYNNCKRNKLIQWLLGTCKEIHGKGRCINFRLICWRHTNLLIR